MMTEIGIEMSVQGEDVTPVSEVPMHAQGNDAPQPRERSSERNWFGLVSLLSALTSLILGLVFSSIMYAIAVIFLNGIPQMVEFASGIAALVFLILGWVAYVKGRASNRKVLIWASIVNGLLIVLPIVKFVFLIFSAVSFYDTHINE